MEFLMLNIAIIDEYSLYIFFVKSMILQSILLPPNPQ